MAITYFFLRRVLFCCLFVYSFYIKINVLNTVAGRLTFERVFMSTILQIASVHFIVTKPTIQLQNVFPVDTITPFFLHKISFFVPGGNLTCCFTFKSK